MNYFTFPMETMNVTQTYLGTASHYPHTTGTPKDYPIDIAGIDAGQSAVFAPVDMKVTAKRGIGQSNITNTVWLVSTEKVKTIVGDTQVFMTLTHWNDSDPFMKKWNVGSVIPKGEIICGEGTDGATANHVHMVVGVGYSDNWVESTTGKWVITGDTRKPEEIMYIDPNFTTTIKNDGNLSWKEIPKNIGNPVSRDETKNQLNVLVNNLNVRESHDVNSSSLGYINVGIYDFKEYFKGNDYEWYLTEYGWIANNGSWLEVYNKKENTIIDNNKENETINQLKEEINSLNLQIKDKDEQIKYLTSQIENKEAPILSFVPEKEDIYAIRISQNEELRLYNLKK